MPVHNDPADAELTRLRAELEAAYTRLEANFCFVNGERVACEVGDIDDGIECRDVTIQLKTRTIERLRAECEGLKSAVQEAWEQRQADLTELQGEIDGLLERARKIGHDVGFGHGGILAVVITNAGWLVAHWMGWLS